MSVSRIDVVELACRDLDRSSEFYSRGLGFSASLRSAGDSAAGAFANFETVERGADLTLKVVGPNQSAQPVVGLRLAFGLPLSTMLEDIERLGGTIVSRSNPTGDWHSIEILDPDGNRIELLIPA